MRKKSWDRVVRKFPDRRDKQQAKPLASGKLLTAEWNVCAYAGLSLHCAAPHRTEKWCCPGRLRPHAMLQM